MHIAPTQDNNHLQTHNPHHPANVANRRALARVRSRFQPQMQAASSGAIERAHESNRLHPNLTFFTPKQSRQANRMARRNDPLGVLGNKVEGFLGLRETAQQAAQMFDPRSKAGLVNIAAMFAGGPKGGGFEGEMAMGRMGGNHEFVPYGENTGSPLARGIEHEGPRGGKGAGIRGLVRRAQGTGRYNRPKGGLADMSRIEALREARGKIGQTNDMIKDYANRTGLQNKQSYERMRMGHAYEQKTGGSLTGYLPHHQGSEPTVGNHDIQPHDYTDRMKLLGLLKRNPESPMLDPSMAVYSQRAIWDMLFGSKSFQGLMKPRRP